MKVVDMFVELNCCGTRVRTVGRFAPQAQLNKSLIVTIQPAKHSIFSFAEYNSPYQMQAQNQNADKRKKDFRR